MRKYRRLKTKKLCMVYLFMAMAVTGCASDPENIKTARVSPLLYKNYTCDQIILETDIVSSEVDHLYASLEKKATSDQWQMGIGLVLFWPALFFLEGGDGSDAVEYGRLKGEYKALQKVAVSKKCDMSLLAGFKTVEEVTEEAKKKAESSK